MLDRLVLVIELEGPPQGKGRARSFIRPGSRPELVGGKLMLRDGIGHYTPKTTKAYEKALGLQAKVNMMQARLKKIDGLLPVRAEIVSTFAIPDGWADMEIELACKGMIRPICKPDWDNIAKVTDALNKIVWHDDQQVVDGRVQKFYGERSHLRIEIYL